MELRGTQRSPELALRSTDLRAPENLIFPALTLCPTQLDKQAKDIWQKCHKEAKKITTRKIIATSNKVLVRTVSLHFFKKCWQPIINFGLYQYQYAKQFKIKWLLMTLLKIFRVGRAFLIIFFFRKIQHKILHLNIQLFWGFFIFGAWHLKTGPKSKNGSEDKKNWHLLSDTSGWGERGAFWSPYQLHCKKIF